MFNYIVNNNIILKIVCEEKILLKLKKEIGDYYEFVEGKFQQDFTIYLYVDFVKYKKVSKQFLLSNNNVEIKLYKDREGLVILDKSKKEIIAFYENINDNVIQFIEEIIISIFGMFLTRQNYYFIHSACVEKKEKAVAIIGDRSSGKTTLLNALMQNKFNFICNSHLGLKDTEKSIQVIGAPSRVGMRVETIEKSTNLDIRKKIFLYTEFRKRFGGKAEKNLKLYRNKKFNIKINEIKDIYDVKLINSALLKLILVPIYIEPIEHIKIEKLNDIQKKEILLKNRREGIYDTNKYMTALDICKKNDLPSNLNQIDAYKVYQNEKCIDELIEFIQLRIN